MTSLVPDRRLGSVRADPRTARQLERVRRPAKPAAARAAGRAHAGPHTSRGHAPCATRRCARAIRPMARWWCATASSSARAGTTSCCTATRPRIPNCWRCATRRAGSARATCRDCDVYSTAMPCAMCQGALYWGRIRRVYTEGSVGSRAPRRGSGADADLRQALRAEEIRHRQRPPHGLHRRGRGRRDRVPARQPDLVVSVAQRHAALRGPRPAHRLRPDRHGRQRQAAGLRPAAATPTRSSASTCSRCGISSRSATASSSSSTTGARRSASSGRAATAIASPASSTWRRWSRR